MSPRLAFLCLALFLVACSPTPGERAPLEIEEVEVGAPVDAGLSTERDEKGRRPASGGWILEGGPTDLPLHRPARLVDSGKTAAGRTYVVFHTSTGLDAVRSGLVRRLPAAGWSTSEPAGGLTATRGAEQVDFLFAPLEPGTEIRVEY